MTAPTVLVVDDNIVTLEVTARILEREGYQVARAADGAQALRMTRELRPGLVLLDVVLPDISGFEVLSQIRSEPALAGIQVVLLSAQRTGPDQQAAGLEGGADGYIVRPVAGMELIARVRLHLRQRELLEQLQSSEERFRSSFEQAAVGMAHVAPDGRFLRVNDRLCGILGYERNALLATTLAELTRAEDQAGSDSARQALLTGGQSSYSVEKQYRRRNGDLVWVHEVASLERPAAGAAKYFITVVEDITARKLAEQATAEQAALVRIAGRTARLGGWIIQLPERTLIWSDETCAIHDVPAGYTPTLDEGINYFLPEHRDEVMRRITACAESGTAYDFELPKVTAAGRQIWVRSIGEAVRDADGRVIALQGAFQDVTESHRTQEALQESAVRLREQASLLDLAQDAILVRDLDHRVLYWNRSAERLYGWSAAEVMGQSVRDLLHRDSGPFLQAVEITLTKGEWSGELDQTARDGTALSIEARWTLVRDPEGKPKSILAINTDITQRKQLEQQYLRAQRMESIGTLAGGIAHDLNNVLAPILMSIELLQAGEDDQERLDILSTIEGSAKRGAAMVRQVLSFARGMEGRRVDVRLQNVIGDMGRIARDTFPKNIRFEERVSSDLWTIQADPTQIHQVLINLCVNARDAMPAGGLITVRADNCSIDTHYAALNIDARVGPYVKIEVEDTGPGISRDMIDKIFDPFFTTKEVGKGTGLGLATSAAIVKSHAGFMVVDGGWGTGARFRVYLPAVTKPSTGPATGTRPRLPRGNGETILVVDDEAPIRAITKQTLESFGYRVLLAADGSEAVAIYARHQAEISVVFTDMMMPVMDGAATIEVLRRMNPNVRIIGASGRPAEGQGALLTTGALTHFLPKPYTAVTLLSAIRAALDA